MEKILRVCLIALCAIAIIMANINPLLALVILVIGIAIGYVTGCQQERIARLEQAQKHRNPYRTNDGLEDAMAILLDIKRAREYADLREQQAMLILQKIRSEPDDYDTETPNKKRNI